MKTKQVYTGQSESAHGGRERATTPRARGSEKDGAASRAPSEDPRIAGFHVSPRPRTCEVSREPCMFPGRLPHGAKAKCCHLLAHVFDTAVVGMTGGFSGFYLMNSDWRRRSWNMEVGHTLCGTKRYTGKELNSLILETSVAFSGFGLIITSSSFYQALWFCNHTPPPYRILLRNDELKLGCPCQWVNYQMIQ